MSKLSTTIDYLQKQVDWLERVLAACVDRTEAVRSQLEAARRELQAKLDMVDTK